MALQQISKSHLILARFLLVKNYSVTVNGAKCGKNQFLEDYKVYHLETSLFQKTLLGLGSAVVSLVDPGRADMIAALGETTGMKSLQNLRTQMLASDEGSRILTEKPRITTATVDINKLETLKEGTVGKAYANFLKKYGYTPDARLAVRFVDDVELAYVVQRYREVHDLFHTVLDMPTNMLGEVTVKWVEAIQTKLPMCIGGALFGAARLAPKFCRLYSTQRKNIQLDPSLSIDQIDSDSIKKLPGKVRTSCTAVPDEIMTAILDILKEKNYPGIIEDGKKLDCYLHSRKPPIEFQEKELKRKEFLEEVKSKFPPELLEATEDEIAFRNNLITGKVNILMRSRLYHWKPLLMNDKMGCTYLVARAAAEYAVLRRVFNEIRERDENFAPVNLFDFGSGVGTVLWLTHEFWGKSLKEYFTVDSSADMNDLARLILQYNNPSKDVFVKNLFQRQFLPTTRRQYDLVVSAYSLLELDSLRSRADIISNLWAKTNKYLVVVEQGTNAGFQLVNEARDLILQLEGNDQERCHIFAPCPHEFSCPRFREIPKTPCNFPVSYFPLRKLSMNFSSKKEYFSFVILKRGPRDKSDQKWPRIVRETLHRHKHIVCRLCTNSGQLQDVYFTASKQGKVVYKCVKKSSWGDIVPVTMRDKDEPDVSANKQ